MKRKRSNDVKAKKSTKRSRKSEAPTRERNHTPGYSHKVGLG